RLRGSLISLNSGFNGLVSGPTRLPETTRELNRLPASTATAGAFLTPLASNEALIRRMLALSWHYRWGCLRLLALQGILLWPALAALALLGLGIDVVLYHAGAVKHPAKYPFGLPPPPDWPPLAEVGLIAGAILLVAIGRGFLNYIYAVESAKLIH